MRDTSHDEDSIDARSGSTPIEMQSALYHEAQRDCKYI